MDRIDEDLLALLQEDGRATLSDLAKSVNLTRPSVAERIRKFRDAGVIEGFSAIVAPQAVGRPLLVFIQLGELRVACRAVEKAVSEDPDVLECYRVTGEASYFIKAAVADTRALEALVDRLIQHGRVNTSIVLSTPVPRRPTLPPM